MTIKSFASAVLCVLALCVTAQAQEKGAVGAKKEPVMDEKQKAAMEAWQKASTPGPQHQKLADMAGTWDVTIKSFEGGGEPQVSKGKAMRKMIFGGRYLHEDYKGTYMGQPFDGMGLTGFDNVLKQFTTVWIDSMSTGVGVGTGEMDSEGKVLKTSVTYSDPMTGKATTMRQVLKMESKDLETFEMYGPGPDGKEVKMMEMTYKRVK
jgi:hypothetical protein